VQRTNKNQHATYRYEPTAIPTSTAGSSTIITLITQHHQQELFCSGLYDDEDDDLAAPTPRQLFNKLLWVGEG
jgi:hypothetical protein